MTSTKIPDETIDWLFGVRPQPPRLLADMPTITIACIICQTPRTFVQIDDHTPDLLALCSACLSTCHATLDILERRVVEQEELVATAIADFDVVWQATDPIDQMRYQRILNERRKAVNDLAHLAKVERGVALALTNGDGLSALLAAEQTRNEAALNASAVLAELGEVIGTLTMLDAAAGWQVPGDVTARRLALGQPSHRLQLVGLPAQYELSLE